MLPAEPTPPGPTTPRAFYAVAAALIALSIIPRLPFLTESIWYDEFLRTRFWLRGDRFISLAFYDVHNPLYNLLMYAWIRLFGDSELSIRIPSMLAAYAASLLFAWWVRRRLGNGMALAVLALCLLSPVHIWHSTEAKNPVFSVLFATWTLVAFDLLRQQPTRARLALAVVASTLGLYTDFVTLLATIPVWLASWIGSEAPARRAVGRAVLLTVLASAPLLVFKAFQTAGLSRGYTHYFSLRQLLILLTNYFANGNTLIPDREYRRWLIFASTPLIFGLLTLGMIHLHRRRLGIVSVAFVLPLIFMLAASAVIDGLYDDNRHYIYQERNLLILFHLYALLLVAGASALPCRTLRGIVVALFLAANVTGSVLMHTVYDDTWTVADPNPDYRAAAGYLDGLTAEHRPPLLVIGRSRLEPLEYYSRNLDLRHLPLESVDPATLRALIAGPGRGETWLFVTPVAEQLTPEDLEVLSHDFALEPVFTARAVTLYHMTPRENP